METLEEKVRKANKQHTCDYCGGIIEKGEIYDWSKHKQDGRLYEWKSHKKCSFLCSVLWDLVDPDEGMTSDDFCYTLHDFCENFICPDCKKYDKDSYECEDDNIFCVDKAYDFLQTHELYRDKRTFYGEIWKCRKIENNKFG